MIKNLLSEYLNNRSNLIELIVVTIVMAFSVSLIVGSITLLNSFKPVISIYIGITIVIICLIYFFIRTSFSLKKDKKFKGFILYDEDKNILKDVYDYRFLNSIVTYLNAAFLENIALARQWKEEPLSAVGSFDEKTRTLKIVQNNSYNLLCQATEYYVLQRICICLTDYFNRISKDNEKFIKTYNRNEVPDILLTNKFFELFSKPVNERPLFSENTHFICENTTSAYFGGTMYDEFKLKLPKKSSIRRIDNQCIEIDTPRFKIQFKVYFDYTAFLLPRGFEEFYLKEKPLIGYYGSNRPFNIQIDFNIKFKILSFLSVKGWDYYRWVDLLLNDLEKNISHESFFKKINWETAHTILYCMKNQEEQTTKEKIN